MSGFTLPSSPLSLPLSYPKKGGCSEGQTHPTQAADGNDGGGRGRLRGVCRTAPLGGNRTSLCGKTPSTSLQCMHTTIEARAERQEVLHLSEGVPSGPRRVPSTQQRCTSGPDPVGCAGTKGERREHVERQASRRVLCRSRTLQIDAANIQARVLDLPREQNVSAQTPARSTSEEGAQKVLLWAVLGRKALLHWGAETVHSPRA